MSHLEFCACGHPHDHLGKPCGRCPCPEGIRVDVATLRVLGDIANLMAHNQTLLLEHSQKLARILAVIEETTGMQSALVDAGNGRARVEVKPKILLPR